MFTIASGRACRRLPHPLYVIDIDPETSSVIVGEAEICSRRNLKSATPCGTTREAALRGHRKNSLRPCWRRRDRDHREKHTAHVRLHEPQKAVTPGQAAVFYDGDRVVGGGWIARQKAAWLRDYYSNAFLAFSRSSSLDF